MSLPEHELNNLTFRAYCNNEALLEYTLRFEKQVARAFEELRHEWMKKHGWSSRLAYVAARYKVLKAFAELKEEGVFEEIEDVDDEE